MRRRVSLVFLLCALGAGCRTSDVDNRPKDPLLESKKPVDRHDEPLPPTLLAAEPAPPPLPTVIVRQDAPPRKRLQGQTVSGGRDAVVAVPATRRVPGRESPYEHADDYSSLQGVLEKDYEGHFELRYGEATTEDRLGGKVSLDDDSRLAPFHDGDVVRVIGALVPSLDGANQSAWNQYPRYRIREIRLLGGN